MLFFGVSGNHLVMMQAASLRAMHLEQHFTWLLRKASVLDDTNSLQLVDQPPKATLERIAKTPVREIDLGGALVPVPEEVIDSAVDKKSRAKQVSESVSLGGGKDLGALLLGAIKGAMSPAAAAKLDLQTLADSN